MRAHPASTDTAPGDAGGAPERLVGPIDKRRRSLYLGDAASPRVAEITLYPNLSIPRERQ